MQRSFQDIQREFSAHLRDPDRAPPPAGIEDRRLAIYRRLFYNNAQSFLAQAFPVLRAITPDDEWASLIKRFYARHQCRRPQFYQLAEEFLEYLQAHQQTEAAGFRLELAHYEWIELKLAIDPAPVPPFQRATAISASQRPVFSPWLEILSYDWPVHQIGPDHQPEQAPDMPTCLVVFRTLQDDVNFLQLNVLTAALLELLHDQRLSLEQAVAQLAGNADCSPDNLLGAAQELMTTLLQRGALLGVAADAA